MFSNDVRLFLYFLVIASSGQLIGRLLVFLYRRKAVEQALRRRDRCQSASTNLSFDRPIQRRRFTTTEGEPSWICSCCDGGITLTWVPLSCRTWLASVLSFFAILFVLRKMGRPRSAAHIFGVRCLPVHKTVCSLATLQPPTSNHPPLCYSHNPLFHAICFASHIHLLSTTPTSPNCYPIRIDRIMFSFLLVRLFVVLPLVVLLLHTFSLLSFLRYLQRKHPTHANQILHSLAHCFRNNTLMVHCNTSLVSGADTYQLANIYFLVSC